MSSSEEYLDSLLQSATREIEEVKGESLLEESLSEESLSKESLSEESLSQESPLEEVVSATDAISGVAEEEVSDVSVEEVSDVAVAKASAEEINADEIDTLMAILESKPESPKQESLKQESPMQEDIKPVDRRQEVSAEELQEIEQLQAMRQSLSNAASDHEDVVTILEGMDEDSELGEISSLLKKSDSHELVSDDLISSLLQTEEESMAAPNPKREELATPPNKTSEAEAPKQKDKKKKKVADAVTSDVLGIQELDNKSKKPWWKKLATSRKDKKEEDSSVPVQDIDATFLELDELDAHLVTPDGKNSTASSKSRVIVKEEDNIQTKSESKKPKKSFLSLLFDEEPEEQDKNAAPGTGESDDGINLPEKPDKSSKKSKKKDKKGKDAGKSNEDILEEMDGEDAASAKGKKKKEKAPKKKLKILDDAPAEPVRPLSKKVIRGMVAMVAAVLSLILISAYYLPGMVEVIKAKAIYYNEADYVSAYQMLYNHKLGESDQILFEKATILAALQIRQDRYEQYEKQGEPLYAADVLLSMLSYAANVSESAESLGIIEQVEEYRQEAEAVLLDMYGFSEEDILRVQAIEADDAYTYELTQILIGDTGEEMDETVDPVGENQEQLPDPLPGEEELIERWSEEESQEMQEVDSSPISQEDPLPGEEGLWNIQGETQE